MENLWPDFSKIESIRVPAEILEEQAKLLPKITNDMIYATVEKDENIDPYVTADLALLDFKYNFYIRAKFIESYGFRVFKLYHDIVIYPIHIDLDRSIRSELGIDTGIIQIDNEKEFIDFIKEVFGSNKIRNVISSLISLSK